MGQILFERKLATVGLKDRDRATGLADLNESLRSFIDKAERLDALTTPTRSLRTRLMKGFKTSKLHLSQWITTEH